MFRFETPLFLLLLLPLAVGFFFSFRRSPGVVFSSLGTVPRRKSWRIRLLPLPRILLGLSLAGLVLTLARPLRFKGEASDRHRGILLEMVLDRSGSMGTWMDRQKSRNRLDVVKETFLDFLADRKEDVIGLTVFAGYADTLSPPTVSHGIFPAFIDAVALAEKEEDGTAIGDAIALAVGRIVSFREGQGPDFSRDGVVILLTDGQNNRGRMTPEEAAELAARKGVTIYTIGFGGGYYQNAFGFWEKVPPEMGVDAASLKAVAEATGGLYFNAENENSLKKIYGKIDELEKIQVEQLSYREREELFPLFLILSLGLLFLGLFGAEVLLPAVEAEP